jgi:predicted TPR repeat methyltransferase
MLLPEGAEMLELGSGPGHDACFFEERGVRVMRTDGTQAFVEHLRLQGHKAELLEITTQGLGGPYDVIFASAVLLHLTPLQLAEVLHKTWRACHADGLLAFTVKEGAGAAWSTAKIDAPRYFVYWTEQSLREMLSATGWTALQIRHVDGRHEPWLYVICRRRP